MLDGVLARHESCPLGNQWCLQWLTVKPEEVLVGSVRTSDQLVLRLTNDHFSEQYLTNMSSVVYKETIYHLSGNDLYTL
jgi:hypothetical protein